MNEECRMNNGQEKGATVNGRRKCKDNGQATMSRGALPSMTNDSEAQGVLNW
jgi:hypothetical protein